MSHTVNFPTRFQNSSSTAIDNLFIDSTRLNSSYTAPIIKGLSDHDAQFLTISDINTEINLAPFKWRLRKIDNETIAQFQCLLVNETSDPIFKNWDTNYKFNSFLDTFLKIFEASFPVQNESLEKQEMTGLLKELKYSVDIKGAYIFSTEEGKIHT
jgi:hypothetical protein